MNLNTFHFQLQTGNPFHWYGFSGFQFSRSRTVLAALALAMLSGSPLADALARDKVVERVDTYESPRQLSKKSTGGTSTRYGWAIEPVKVTPELAAYFKLPANWPTTHYAFVSAPTSDTGRVMQSGNITLLNLDNGRTEGVLENPNPKENAGFGTNISFDPETNLMAVGGYGADEGYLFNFAKKSHLLLQHPNFKPHWGKDSTYPNAEKVPMEKYPDKFWPDGTTAQIIHNPVTGRVEIFVGGTLTISKTTDETGRILQRYLNIQSFDTEGNHLEELLAPSNSFNRVKFYCFEEPAPKSFMVTGKNVVWGSNKMNGLDRIYFFALDDPRRTPRPVIQSIQRREIERGEYGSTYASYKGDVVVAFRGRDSYESPRDHGKLAVITIGPINTSMIKREIFVGELLGKNIDITSFDICGDIAVIAWRPLRGVEDYLNRPDQPDNVTSFGFCNLETGKFVELPGYQETFSLLDGVPTIKFFPDNPHVFVYGLRDGINETYRIEYRGAVRKVTLRPGFLEESGLLSPVPTVSGL